MCYSDATSLARQWSLALGISLSVLVSGCGGSDGPTATTSGDVRAIVMTTGANVPTSYTVTVAGQARVNAPVNGAVILPNIRIGPQQVTLGGVPANCTVTPPSATLSVTVVAGQTVDVTFMASCA